MKIIEKFQQGKRTATDTCEDGIVTTDNFAAVIDGSTSKGNLRWNGRTSGRVAMELLTESICNLPAHCMAQEAVETLTACIRRFYESHGMLEDAIRNPENRLTASVVICSYFRKEVWMIGDCLCRFNGETYTHPKVVDGILSEIRADVITYLLKKGYSIDSLRQRDLAREWLLPVLKMQCAFQNAMDAGSYGYTVLDGFTVDFSDVRVLALPVGTTEVILASDGYPYLYDTLADTECCLSDILSDDPLCYREFKSTKGMQIGNVSFDDRSFLRIALI